MLRDQILTIAFLADFFQFFQNNSNNTTHQSQKTWRSFTLLHI